MSFNPYIERKYITIAPETFKKYTLYVRICFFCFFFFFLICVSFSWTDYFNNICHGDELSTSKLVQLCKICCSSLFCIYIYIYFQHWYSFYNQLCLLSSELDPRYKRFFFVTISTNHFVRVKHSSHLFCVQSGFFFCSLFLVVPWIGLLCFAVRETLFAVSGLPVLKFT